MSGFAERGAVSGQRWAAVRYDGEGLWQLVQGNKARLEF